MVEVVHGYKCEKCHDRGNKQRVVLIVHSPNILIVQLKRFEWDGAKVNTQVAIPTILDLDSYRDIDNDDSMRYELTAVIKHLGNLNQGHYICSAKASDNQWYHFDDRKKSVGTVSEAISGSKNSFSPYILFYQRKEE
jgi:ubiquitin C-terminal hydrolase